MSRQESSFADPERQSSSYINTDPREQRVEQQQEYADPYNDPGYQHMGGSKIQPPQRRRKLGPVLILLLTALLVLGIGAGTAMGRAGMQPMQKSEMHTFVVGTQPDLVIHNGSGAVHIHTGNVGNVIVQANKHAFGLGGTPDDMHVKYSQDGDKIQLDTADQPFFFFGFQSVDFDVTVPSTTNVNVDTGSGSVDVANVTGEVEVETGSGSIVAHDLNAGQNNDIKLKTGSGSITADKVNGPVTLTTGSGRIQASGTISGQSLVKTGSGAITFNGSLDPQGNYRFETGSGSVDLTLPGSSAFSLDKNTGSGSVRNDFGSDTVGNDPRAKLTIETGSGSITIHKGF